MCNCREEKAEKLLELAKEELPAGAKILKFGLGHYALVSTDHGFDLRLTLDLDVTYEATKKSRSREVTAIKKKSFPCLANFCPWCGEKFVNDEGWRLAPVGDGRMITVGEEEFALFEIQTTDVNVFADNDAALCFVMDKAEKGSAQHQHALSRHQAAENEVRNWREEEKLKNQGVSDES